MLHAPLTTLHVVSLILQRFAERPELRPQLLAGSGIGAADLDNPDARITRVQEQQVCANALTLRADMGLELGRSLHVSSYGLLGYAALSADTLGDALRLLLHYPALLGTYFRLELLVHEEQAWLRASNYRDRAALEAFNVEMCLASMKLTCDELLGQPVSVSQACFRHARPGYAERYGESFPCALSFAASDNAFAFPAALLERPLPLADSVTHGGMVERCRRLNAEFSSRQAWLERVRQLLAAQLAEPPGLENLAQQMYCSPRTLRRHLQELGTSYQGLLDELRFARAKALLSEAQWPVYRIAEVLGFSETASFRHAFQRWSGVPPSRFRT